MGIYYYIHLIKYGSSNTDQMIERVNTKQKIIGTYSQHNNSETIYTLKITNKKNMV